ncbi:hypothetical protein [Salinarimonas soli]|uniref:hypothetical protein n=1 Tax=Salinarimonas soli TaxID=1638099 RepID=UPI001661F597|nr:hypothetical protein [Salinarimonas soli]
MTISSTNPALPLTEMELCSWLGSALPGERLVYHRGHLALDCSPTTARLSEQERSALQRLARRALQLADKGLVCLLQQRHGPDDYSYILVACPKRSGRRSPGVPAKVTLVPEVAS